MNKIITLIAMLVLVSSANAWINYNNYTVKKSSVQVEYLESYNKKDFQKYWDEPGFHADAYAWWSPDKSIIIYVLTSKRFNSKGLSINFMESLPSKPKVQTLFLYIPYLYDIRRAFIEITSKTYPTNCGLYISSGPSCDRLIKSIKLTYYTRYNSEKDLPQAALGTFDYIGDCKYQTLDKKKDKYFIQAVTITPYVPTSYIPIYLKSRTGPMFHLSADEYYGNYDYWKEGCQITDIEIEYLQPADDKAMRRSFANAYEEECYQQTKNTFYEANLNPTAATFGDQSPADVNNDKAINSADVVAVYNYIMNGSDEYKGHAYVDLGLPSGTMWAACNVGAAVPEAWGDLYAYGEKTTFNLTNPTYAIASYSIPTTTPTMTDWNGWHYPTADDVFELLNNTISSKCTINGNDCWILTSKINGATLTFPTPGYADKDGHHDDGQGYYWTSWPSVSNTQSHIMFFSDSNLPPGPDIFVNHTKSYGASLRMTCKP